MKNQQSENKQSNSTVARGLFILGGTWAAIFSPIVIIIMAYIIPFGNALSRSYILKLVNTDLGRVFLLLMISLPIWFGLPKILTILNEFKVYPKRGKFLIYALALAWTAHAIFILFVRV